MSNLIKLGIGNATAAFKGEGSIIKLGIGGVKYTFVSHGARKEYSPLIRPTIKANQG